MTDEKLMLLLDFDKDDLDANREKRFSERQLMRYPVPTPNFFQRWGLRLSVSCAVALIAACSVWTSTISFALASPVFSTTGAALLTFILMFGLMLFGMSMLPVDDLFAGNQPKIAHTTAKMRLFSEDGVVQMRVGKIHLDIDARQFDELTMYRRLNPDLLYRVYHTRPGGDFLSLEVVERT